VKGKSIEPAENTLTRFHIAALSWTTT